MVNSEMLEQRAPAVEDGRPAGALNGVLNNPSSVTGTLVPGLESGPVVAGPVSPVARHSRGESVIAAMARAGVRQPNGDKDKTSDTVPINISLDTTTKPKAATLFILSAGRDTVSPVAQGATDGTPDQSSGADDIRRATGNGDNSRRMNGKPPDGTLPGETGIEGEDPRARDRANYAFAWDDTHRIIDLARMKMTGEEDRDALSAMLGGEYDTATLDATIRALGPLQGVQKARMGQPQKTVGVIDRPDSVPNGYVARSLIGRTNPVDIIGDQFDPVRRGQIAQMTTEYIRGSGNVNVTSLPEERASGKKYDVLIWRDQPNVGDYVAPMEPEPNVLGITDKIHEVLEMLSPDGVLIIPPGEASMDPIREDARRIEYGYTVTRVLSAIVDANAHSAEEGMPKNEDYTYETILIRPKPRI